MIIWVTRKNWIKRLCHQILIAGQQTDSLAVPVKDIVLYKHKHVPYICYCLTSIPWLYWQITLCFYYSGKENIGTFTCVYQCTYVQVLCTHFYSSIISDSNLASRRILLSPTLTERPLIFSPHLLLVSSFLVAKATLELAGYVPSVCMSITHFSLLQMRKYTYGWASDSREVDLSQP